jgi:hypothetical protein
MTGLAFSVEAVRLALGDPGVASVEVAAPFTASAAEVARLVVRFSDGSDPITVIGKAATGPGLAAARRERRFFERIAPLWPAPTPALLGAHEAGDEPQLLLVTEDLGAAGYALVTEASVAQLHAVVDTLVAFHARFWGDLPGELFPCGDPSSSQSAQAWPAAAITAHAVAAGEATARFIAGVELTAAERALLDRILAAWEPQFLARVAGGHALTLIHGDFHLLGNVLFAEHARRPRVIDWSELKPGLGPHDLAYCLHAAPSDQRPTRDLALLRRYWDGLRAAGIADYGWPLCRWDYQFSLLTNLFQSVFQRSAFWFRRTAGLIDEHAALTALDTAPPRP